MATQTTLLTYEVDQPALAGQAASYVDRVLRGANPADLPIQSPSRYKLTVDQRIARELRVSLPPAILVQADEIID